MTSFLQRFSINAASTGIIDAHFQLRVKAERKSHSVKEPIPTDFLLIVNGRPSNNLLEVLIAKRKQADGKSSGFSPSPSYATATPSTEPSPRRPAGLSLDCTTDPYPALDLPFRKTLKISVVFVESPSEFWCQLVEEASVLEQLMDFLQLAFDQQKLSPLSPWPPRLRHPVAARFTDDDAWYRAVVTAVGDGDKIEVLFVDFG